MVKKLCWMLLIMSLAISALHCGGTGGSPVAPDERPALQNPSIPAGQNSLWGVWQVVVDKSTGKASVTSLRQSDLALNVTGFLEPPPLTNLTVDFTTLQIDTVNNYILADVILTHPFPTPDNVFDGYDVRGVVFGPEVRNADGWTRMMNPAEFSGEAFGYVDGGIGTPDSFANYAGNWFGYKYFCDDLGFQDDYTTFFSSETNLANRGRFRGGQSNTRRYDLYFGNGYSNFLVFNYAVVASYDWPVGSAPYDFEDFGITTSNVAEAFCGKINVISSGIAQGGGGSVVGNISLDAEVWDWQGLQSTEVDVISDILADTPASAFYDPGTTTKSGIYHFPNIPAQGTNTTGWGDIWVVATDNSQTFGSSWFMNLLSTSNPAYNDPVFSVYRLRFEIPDNTPPIAAAVANPTEPAVNANVTLDASTSSDLQDTLTQLTFEWDLNNDGTFEINNGNNPIYITQFASVGDYTVDLRVTDTSAASDTLDTKLLIPVTVCGGSGAHVDNDGVINISNFSVLPNNVPRYGLSFLTQGTYAGQAVAQMGPYSLGVFDADAAGNVTGTKIAKLRPYYRRGPAGPIYQDQVVFLIDVCPVGGYIMTVTDTRHWNGTMTIHLHKLTVYSADGSLIVKTIRDTALMQIDAVCALDCDENGDIWMVAWYAGSSGNNPQYLLVKIPYIGGALLWDLANMKKWDITSYLPQPNNPVIDMAIDYADNRIYILHPGTNGDGKLSAFDMDAMTLIDPAFNTSESVTPVFSDQMKVANEYLGGLSSPDSEYWSQTYAFAGMEIDHQESAREKCRIICYSRIDDGSGGNMPEVVRISALNEILDRQNGTFSLRNFGLNNDANTTKRNLAFPGIQAVARLWDAPSGW